MDKADNSKNFTRFSKKLFFLSRIFVEKEKSRKDLDQFLEKMRGSIIRMRLSYKDIDTLREKLENQIDWERKYAHYFKVGDRETRDLYSQLFYLEQKLRETQEERYGILEENSNKIAQMSQNINNLKNKINFLLMDKIRKQQRLQALDNKIKSRIDLEGYFDS